MSAAAITQLISDSSPRDGHALLGQRCITSPSGLTMSTPQSGHFAGMRNRRVPFAWGRTGPTTCGITSPARCTITVSPCADVLAVDVLLVVQRRLGDGDAADLHGLELRPRVERPGAADAHVDLQELRLRGHRRPLERPRPARPPVQRAEALLLVERVHLDDDAVDLVVELDALRLPLRALARDRLERLVALRVRVHAEAALAQPLERLPVGGELDPVAPAGAVDPDGQVALGRDLRVELAQRPGGRVARVRARASCPRRRGAR